MIPLFKVRMPESVNAAVQEVLASGYIGQGPKVEKFEEALAPWFGNRRPVTVNSGTSAIHLALRVAGVGPGDDVITTPMTCTATNMPILERGARIVWADINPYTGNLDPAELKRLITPRTKAIMCVHWGGHPCDLDEISYVADLHGIPVIEDAAHAFGSVYKDALIGSHSRFVCFSFQAIKHLTTVDGGALVCRRPDDAERAKLLRWYGIDRNQKGGDLRCEADIQEHGYKFHMNDVAAAIGLEQLKGIRDVLNAHRENAEFYRGGLAALRPGGNMRMLDCQPHSSSSCWLFTILVKDRDAFIKFMKEHGVMASQVHARNDLHTAFDAFRRPSLPGVDLFSSRQVSVPVGWWLSYEDRLTVLRLMLKWNN